MKSAILFLSIASLPIQAIAEPSLTIYNQNFGVVRETIPLDLKQGINEISFSDSTVHLEPDSVILRDPTGKLQFSLPGEPIFPALGDDSILKPTLSSGRFIRTRR